MSRPPYLPTNRCLAVQSSTGWTCKSKGGASGSPQPDGNFEPGYGLVGQNFNQSSWTNVKATSVGQTSEGTLTQSNFHGVHNCAGVTEYQHRVPREFLSGGWDYGRCMGLVLFQYQFPFPVAIRVELSVTGHEQWGFPAWEAGGFCLLLRQSTAVDWYNAAIIPGARSAFDIPERWLWSVADQGVRGTAGTVLHETNPWNMNGQNPINTTWNFGTGFRSFAIIFSCYDRVSFRPAQNFASGEWSRYWYADVLYRCRFTIYPR